MKPGCYTALITPFANDQIDADGLAKLVNFQIENGITGILAVGTTGESPVLTWEEHNQVIDRVAAGTKDRSLCIAGAGSNNTREALAASTHAVKAGADAVLLVDPYYNGPSSLEIRKEYVEPVARACPETQVIPYVIPGRTGAQLMPEDLAILHESFPNVGTVKEATGNLDNMKRTRKCCGPDYTILSGDDALTFVMMTDDKIKAAGVISVMSNIAPGAVTRMVEAMHQGEIARAEALNAALKPLFGLVTVSTMEQTPYGEVVCRARNPLAVKAWMQILGMSSGGCRQPLGKMTQNGIEKVLSAARAVQSTNPEIFKPVESFFNVNVAERLENPENWKDLVYPDYS